jgi:hypothetical protein
MHHDPLRRRDPLDRALLPARVLEGRGIGRAVLQSAIIEPYDGPTGLNVLQGSVARRLYERHGFTLDSEDDVDVWLTLRRGLMLNPSIVAVCSDSSDSRARFPTETDTFPASSP